MTKKYLVTYGDLADPAVPGLWVTRKRLGCRTWYLQGGGRDPADTGRWVL